MSSPDPKPKTVRKPVRRRVVLEAVPASELPPTLTWIERLKRDIRTGGLGLLGSLVLHTIALVILGLIWFQVSTSGDGDPLAVSWGPAGSARGGKSGRKLTPVAIPLNLGPSPNTIDTSPAAKSNTGTSDGQGAGKGQGTSVGDGVGVSPVDVRNSLGSRNPRMRGSVEGAAAGTDADNAIKMGLLWLSRQQENDGHWELHQGYPDHGFSTIRTDTGATALALLAFLGHGDTHQNGEFSKNVDKGLKWLRAIQDPKTGDLHDLRNEEGRNGAFYAHAMATIVLCESLALTQDKELEAPAKHAVEYLLSSQHPENGGWKYRPISKLMVGDLSVTGWALMALHTARMAGIDVPHEDFVRASAFLDSVRVRGMARYKYEPTTPDSKASPALTAEAILCRQWLGWPKNFPEMTQGVRYVTEEEQTPNWSNGRRNVYAWYYTSQMLHNLGGEDWKKWNQAVQTAVIRNQVKGGKEVGGSWHPTSPPGDPFEHSEKGGRLYMTALCILILETPYRHQPIYAAPEVANK